MNYTNNNDITKNDLGHYCWKLHFNPNWRRIPHLSNHIWIKWCNLSGFNKLNRVWLTNTIRVGRNFHAHSLSCPATDGGCDALHICDAGPSEYKRGAREWMRIDSNLFATVFNLLQICNNGSYRVNITNLSWIPVNGNLFWTYFIRYTEFSFSHDPWSSF